MRGEDGKGIRIFALILQHLAKERSREFELSESDRLRYRTRYFTDSGIIGSKEFVAEYYQRFEKEKATQSL